MSFVLELSEEQEAIVDSVAAASAGPIDWQQCAQLGWIGLGLAEHDGGVGYGVAEEVLVQRALGYALVAEPFLSTVLAAHVASLAHHRPLVDALLGGERRAGIAAGPFVLGADRSNVVVVVETSGAHIWEAATFEDRADAVSIDPASTIQRARPAGSPLLSTVGPEAHQRLLLLGAAHLTGLAERARDLAVEHACNRQQFGKPIGTFQAIKHPCADMAVRAALSYAQAMIAARTFGGQETDVDVTSAAVVAVDAALANGRAAIQVHGGMGFTTEHPVHRVVQRAHVVERMLGGRAALLDQLLSRRADR